MVNNLCKQLLGTVHCSIMLNVLRWSLLIGIGQRRPDVLKHVRHNFTPKKISRYGERGPEPVGFWIFYLVYFWYNFRAKLKKKPQNFWSKIKKIVKSRNFCQQGKFSSKIKIIVKIKMLGKNRKLYQKKKKILTTIENFVKNRNF